MRKSNLVKILKQELSILGDFVEGFNDGENIHPMEVDLALSKVNDIKNELELLKTVESEKEYARDTYSENKPQNEPVVPENNSNEEIVVSERNELIEEANIEEVKGNIETDVKVETTQVDDEEQKQDEFKVIEVTDIDENIAEIEIIPENNEIDETEFSVKEESAIEEVQEEFTDEPVEPVSEISEEQIKTQSEATVEEAIEDIDQSDINISEDLDKEIISETEKPNNETILADKFSQSKPSLNDTLAGIKQNKNLASFLKESPIADLNKAIKLNDRIWYINELFGKNSATYNKAIEKVNNAENLDAALEFLFTNFNWNQERKSTISFLELVFRRFASN